MITIDSKIKKSKDLLISIVDDEAVILGIESGKYIGLNQIGTDIWAKLDKPVVVSELIGDLVKIYDQDLETVQNHVLEFLNTLYEKSLIELIHENQY